MSFVPPSAPPAGVLCCPTHPKVGENMPEYLSTSEVADILGVGVDTIHRYVRDGQLAAFKLPGGRLRFLPEDVTALLTPATEA